MDGLYPWKQHTIADHFPRQTNIRMWANLSHAGGRNVSITLEPRNAVLDKSAIASCMRVVQGRRNSFAAEAQGLLRLGTGVNPPSQAPDLCITVEVHQYTIESSETEQLSYYRARKPIKHVNVPTAWTETLNPEFARLRA